jgi:poly(hydroxyalkanoate) depolymerase family esterase
MNWKQLILSFVALNFLMVTAFAGSWSSGTVKNTSGSLDYKVWVPSGYNRQKPVALVVMLHGCTQKTEELATISGMNDLAEKENFLVVYPEQTATANPLRCWNWFDPKHQSRDAGEPSLIAAIVLDVRSKYSVEAERTYAVGISAGAAMAVVMGVTYPELFAGLATVIGVEYKAGTTVEGGLAAMKVGGPDPVQQGLLGFQAIQKSAVGSKKRMPVIAFHGTKDPYLNPINTDQLIAQWAETNDYLDDGKSNDSVNMNSPRETKGSVPNGYNFTKYSYQDSKGQLLMERWVIEGLGHAWPGSPVTNPFADPKGPNATAEIWRFFSETTTRAKVKGVKG